MLTQELNNTACHSRHHLSHNTAPETLFLTTCQKGKAWILVLLELQCESHHSIQVGTYFWQQPPLNRFDLINLPFKDIKSLMNANFHSFHLVEDNFIGHNHRSGIFNINQRASRIIRVFLLRIISSKNVLHLFQIKPKLIE
ncbi:hypothetical protein M758_9G073600 [Ceratodon purpureus]|nr:hypothetical protein M758_9G073600 [Ceratodon purpureus]